MCCELGTPSKTYDPPPMGIDQRKTTGETNRRPLVTLRVRVWRVNIHAIDHEWK